MTRTARVRSVSYRTVLVIITLLCTTVIYDIVEPVFYTPRFANIDTRVLVIDINNLTGIDACDDDVCVVQGLSVEEFRTLGKAKAQIIIIIGHGMTVYSDWPSLVESGDYSLETSTPIDPLWLILHPVLVTTNSVLRGEVYNQTVVAVGHNILWFSHTIAGKTVLLVTCGAPGITKFSTLFIQRGASMVCYTTTRIPLEQARYVIESLVNGEMGVDEVLVALGLECMK